MSPAPAPLLATPIRAPEQPGQPGLENRWIPHDRHRLGPGGRAADQFDVGPADRESLRESSDRGSVRRAVHRTGDDGDHERLGAVSAADGGPGGPRLDADGETQHRGIVRPIGGRRYDGNRVDEDE
jgi:hypothetical protein